MPIYAYKCDSCGFAKDVLQKMSDAPLEVCPSCNKPEFKKQVTAAGFQLKGSGWYATDFKGSGSAPSTAVAPSNSDSSSTAATPAAESAPAKAEAAPSAPSVSTTPPASGS
jgi:putative FmdB family regulatory protein